MRGYRTLPAALCLHTLPAFSADLLSNTACIQHKRECQLIVVGWPQQNIRSINEIGNITQHMFVSTSHQVKKYQELAAEDVRFDAPLADACYEDRQSYCSNVPAGSARVIRCLMKQREKLSVNCRAVLFDEEVRAQMCAFPRACALYCKDLELVGCCWCGCRGNCGVLACSPCLSIHTTLEHQYTTMRTSSPIWHVSNSVHVEHPL